MNESMIVKQIPFEKVIPFLKVGEKNLLINFNSPLEALRALRELIRHRTKGETNIRIIAARYKEVYLAFTVNLDSLYILGINPIEPSQLEENNFKTKYGLHKREIDYDGSNVPLNAHKLLDAFCNILNKPEKEIDKKQLKVLIFFICEAARLETAARTVYEALEGADYSKRYEWINHAEILTNWDKILNFLNAKKGKPFNTMVTNNDIAYYIENEKPSQTVDNIHKAMVELGFFKKSDCNFTQGSYTYKNNTVTPKNIPDTIVGSGYDVINGEYISMQGAKVANPIVDMDKPVNLITQKYIKSDVMKAEGSTLKEVMTHFNAKLKVDTSFYIFSGGAEAEFDITSKNQYEYSYFRFYSKFINERQYLSSDTYKKYLTQDFKNDINYMQDIDLLFSKYGTHMIKEILIGGRLTFSFAYHKNSDENEQRISASVNAAFSEYLKVHSTAEYSQNAKYVASKSNIYVSTFGGEHCELHSLELFAKNYPVWLESLKNRDYWSPCDIADMSNMIPIWQLCTDSKRSSEIEQRYYELLYQRTKKLYPAEFFIDDKIFITRGKTDFEARKKCPMEYNMVYKNIHRGIENNFSYLCYKPCSKLGQYLNLMAIFILHADVPKISGHIPVHFENKRFECISMGYFNEFTENGKKYYTHLLAARVRENLQVDRIQILDVDILYGDSQLPKDWIYATSATNTDIPENCNKGYDTEPAYIIYRRKSYR